MAGQTMRWFSKTIGSYTLDKEHTICLRIQNILRSNTLAGAVIQRLEYYIYMYMYGERKYTCYTHCMLCLYVTLCTLLKCSCTNLRFY